MLFPIERAACTTMPDAANSMLAFVLTRRDRKNWLIDMRDIEPGHPVYEGIKRIILEDLGYCQRSAPKP